MTHESNSSNHNATLSANSEHPAPTILSLLRSLTTIRPSIPWLVTATALVCAAIYCTTVRVPNSVLDVGGLQLLVAGMLLAAITCALISVRVRAKRTYGIAWLSTAAAFVSCVILT